MRLTLNYQQVRRAAQMCVSCLLPSQSVTDPQIDGKPTVTSSTLPRSLGKEGCLEETPGLCKARNAGKHVSGLRRSCRGLHHLRPRRQPCVVKRERAQTLDCMSLWLLLAIPNSYPIDFTIHSCHVYCIRLLCLVICIPYLTQDACVNDLKASMKCSMRSRGLS